MNLGIHHAKRQVAGVPTVYVVDDDDSIRELLTWIVRQAGFAVEAHASAAGFLEAYRPNAPGCLVLDLCIPGMNGLDLQEYLNSHQITLPVIFMSGLADVPRAVSAVKGGAIDFIEKPFDYQRMTALILDCLQRDARHRAERAAADARTARLAGLTQREQEVMRRVVAGQINRVIAEELAISIKTVEAHRARIMEKLGVSSLPELMQVVLGAAHGAH